MMTAVNLTTRQFAVDTENGDSQVRARVTQYPPEFFDDASPSIDLEWLNTSNDDDTKALTAERIETLTLAEAKAMLKCLKAAVRFAEDVEDGDAVVDLRGCCDGDGETD